eukprot:19390-Alexandrium_andersonii.AAC.1
MCNPPSAQGPSVLQSASIGNPPCGNAKSLQAFEPGTAQAQERPQIAPWSSRGVRSERLFVEIPNPPTTW